MIPGILVVLNMVPWCSQQVFSPRAKLSTSEWLWVTAPPATCCSAGTFDRLWDFSHPISTNKPLIPYTRCTDSPPCAARSPPHHVTAGDSSCTTMPLHSLGFPDSPKCPGHGCPQLRGPLHAVPRGRVRQWKLKEVGGVQGLWLKQ